MSIKLRIKAYELQDKHWTIDTYLWYLNAKQISLEENLQEKKRTHLMNGVYLPKNTLKDQTK